MEREKSKDVLALVRERTVLFDGAMGTMLIAEGLSGGEISERWNLDKPDTVKAIHRRYFEAGCDVALTNTFGANRSKLKKKNLEREVFQFNTLAAKLANGVNPGDRFVAGDIGPSGELIAPDGNLSAHDMEGIFAEQAEALDTEKVDLILVETMFSLQEAVAALKGVRTVSQCPVFVSMTYEKKDRGYFTLMGETPEVCSKTLEDVGADVIGANCTIGSKEMIPLARILRDSTNLPVIVQPNAGKPQLKDGKTIYEQDPEDFAEDIEAMVRIGVNVVGGCCGTTPEFISAIYKRIVEHLPPTK
jgi:5-methyltetrahydrofolate--homocysteine methyltransferase